MNTRALLLAFALVSSTALAGGGAAARPAAADPAPTTCAAGDTSDEPHVAAVVVSETADGTEIVDIRISGKNANAFETMSFDIADSRQAGFPMTKTAGSDGNGNPNNGTSLWTVELDLDSYADANGDVQVLLKPGCCWIPGAIVVRSKGR